MMLAEHVSGRWLRPATAREVERYADALWFSTEKMGMRYRLMSGDCPDGRTHDGDDPPTRLGWAEPSPGILILARIPA